MFRRARTRLTLTYIALFTLVIGVFSFVFLGVLALVLTPAFDLAPELTTEQAGEAAFQTTIWRIAAAVVVADLAAIIVVAVVAWLLAARTLGPISEAHARQRRFVADASHEMRTPLTAIRSTGESALLGPEDPGLLRNAVVTMVSSAEHLALLTDDLLTLARSDDATVEHRPEDFDISVLVAETLQAYVAAHPARPRPRVTLAEDVRVLADPVGVGRILTNLLDNAYLYAADAPVPPQVATAADDHDAIVEVRDRGPGIAAADVDRIFEPFYRVHAAADAPEGTGLGLAIARSLARRDHGRLDVSSRPGAGSAFRLVLPRLR